MGAYVPIWCKSHGSFLEGASSPEDLIERAVTAGVHAMAVTDRDGLYGIVRAHEAAKERGVHLLVGAQVTVGSIEQRGELWSTIVLIAQEQRGYSNLCRLVTIGRRRSEKGDSIVTWEEVCNHASGLIAIWGGDTSLIVRPDDVGAVAGPLRDAFGDRLFAMVTRHRRDTEIDQERHVREHAARFDLPIVAAVEVLYHHVDRRALQDVMTCIRHGVTIRTAGRRLKPNDGHALPDVGTFQTLFADDPAAVARTLDIAARCSFSMDQLRYRYPGERIPPGETASSWLRRLSFDGIRRRYGAEVPEKIADQLDRELRLIDELDYGGYFLTMHDIVDFCRTQNILCQGRGSAANSVVCFALQITSVDPMRVDLLFERFLSKERNEPPDIDLDVMHERREEVIQYIYRKYGRDHSAMVANVVRYQPRSAVRDVGKVLGIPETTLDRLAKQLGHYGTLREGDIRDAGLDPANEATQHLMNLATQLVGCPRHLSIHPGGFLLGHAPVHDIVPIENATMADRTVIQWDKDDVDAVGLFKVDILGLGALTQLDLCFKLLKEHRGIDLSMATIPEGDAPTYRMICRAETVGVFQIESRAQMSMLPRLKPRNYYDLVMQISIVRPGPITGGMVHPFLRRRNNEEPIEFPHESLRPVLAKTLGVPLFQEQVMRIAMVAADYTPGEADQLRRDMAAWKRSGRLEKHRERLITRMISKGITPEFADRVFKQIQGFGEYGFPESHAASFALISYAASYLRCHYPAEFTCALLNAQPMGFYSIATIVEDAKRMGVEIRPVDAQSSQWDCTLEPRTPEIESASPAFAVRMGLRFVRSMREAQGRRVAKEREAAPFTSMSDLTRRTGLAERELAILAKSGSFESLGLARRTALWEAPATARTANLSLPFDDDVPPPAFAPLNEGETIAWDYQSSSHSARGHPVGPLRPELQALGIPDARTVRAMRAGSRVRYAGLVICRQRPQTAKNVTFMTLEDETGFVNLVLWEQVFERYSLLVRTAHWLGVTGTLQSQDGVVHVIADEIWIPSGLATPEHRGSRDFH